MNEFDCLYFDDIDVEIDFDSLSAWLLDTFGGERVCTPPELRVAALIKNEKYKIEMRVLSDGPTIGVWGLNGNDPAPAVEKIRREVNRRRHLEIRDYWLRPHEVKATRDQIVRLLTRGEG